MTKWHQETRTLRREAAEASGRWAEDEAAAYLGGQGFELLAKRAKTPVGEVDLILRKRKRDLLVFVEVKYRAKDDDALWTILPRQQQRIARAAEAWLASRPELANLDMRFDAIIVNAKGVASHIDDAFRPEF